MHDLATEGTPPPEPRRRGFAQGRQLRWLLGSALLLYALVGLSILLLPPLFDFAAYYHNFHWPEHEPPTLLTRLATWDAQHYLFIACNGYVRGSPSAAFCPLWPMLVRA